MEVNNEARYARAASRLRGIPPSFLGIDEDERDPTVRGRQLRQAAMLGGALWFASDLLIDQLFDDLEMMADTPTGDVAPGFVGGHFPARFANNYDVKFVRALVVAAADLTARLTRGWSPPDCVAQELLTRTMLDLVELEEETEHLDLPDGWRSDLEQFMFEDLDHEFLYDPAADGFEDDPDFGPPGMAPMDFENWFTPFAGRTLPPYIEAPDPYLE